MCPVCCLQPSDDVALLMPTLSPRAPTLPSSLHPFHGFSFSKTPPPSLYRPCPWPAWIVPRRVSVSIWQAATHTHTHTLITVKINYLDTSQIKKSFIRGREKSKHKDILYEGEIFSWIIQALLVLKKNGKQTCFLTTLQSDVNYRCNDTSMYQCIDLYSDNQTTSIG